MCNLTSGTERYRTIPVACVWEPVKDDGSHCLGRAMVHSHDQDLAREPHQMSNGYMGILAFFMMKMMVDQLEQSMRNPRNAT